MTEPTFASLGKRPVQCFRCKCVADVLALYFESESLRVALHRPWGIASTDLKPKDGEELGAVTAFRFLCPDCMEAGDGAGLHS